MSWRILITCPPMLMTLEHCRERFTVEQFEVTTPEIVQQLSEDQLCEMIADFDGVIAGDDPFTAKVLQIGRQGHLRALAKWGIGVDAIDLEAAKSLGIYTSNTPNVFGDEVADVALGYILLLARQLHRIDQAIRQGEWLKIRGTSLRGKVAGIIGLGSIGSAVADRLHVLGMELLGYDIKPFYTDANKSTNIRQVELAELLNCADYIVVACALTRENHNLINESAFAKMKQGVSIINVARGSLIQESALLSALNSGRVAGAALDVFEKEPLTPDNPLCLYPQVILGSHNSSNTEEAVLRVNQLAIDNLVRDLKRAMQDSQ